MSKRKPVVVMSWAMRRNREVEAVDFAKQLVELLGNENSIEKILLPSMGMIYPVSKVLQDADIHLGAQNISAYANGAQTGEYSIESLIDVKGDYVELGHWERRQYFNETDAVINQKLRLTFEKGLKPILCIGEINHTDDFAEVESFLYLQLFNDLYEVKKEDVEQLVIAYTPIWAVNKSKAASAPHIHQVCGIIRKVLAKLFDVSVAEKIRIIYGGAVSPENATLIVRNKDVDGVFVGRFGSNPVRYAEVVKEVQKNSDKESSF
ncbi:triosephosphate isomerase (TIM) [Enterococcus sp. AZ135]|uniref:triose-phosphate isomerase family protein n=1 Tax=unclassified Enterococcus TaxID=2608891 RepID=UPI003F1EA0CB